MQKRHISHAGALKGHSKLKQRETIKNEATASDPPKEPLQIEAADGAAAQEQDDNAQSDQNDSSDSSDSDSETEIRAELEKLKQQKPQKSQILKKKQSWRNSVMKKPSKSRQVTVMNDTVHSDAHRDFLDKFVR